MVESSVYSHTQDFALGVWLELELTSTPLEVMSREYERYVPKKELPEEIKQLSQEETKCNFCGISYLVHHEVSRLENHVKELQDSLDESERNHKNSIKELMTLRKGVPELEEKLQAREKLLVNFYTYSLSSAPLLQGKYLCINIHLCNCASLNFTCSV